MNFEEFLPTLVAVTPTRGRLTAKITQRLQDVCAECPGRHQWRGQEFFFEITSANLEHLKAGIPEAVWDSQLTQKLFEIEELRRLENTKIIPPMDDGWTFKTKPFPHQLEAFYISRDREAYGFFMEMGTGKSWVGVNTIRYLAKVHGVNRVLILAPNGVHKQWITEQIPEHMEDDFAFKATWYESSKTKTVKDRLKKVMEHDGCQIIAQHIESMSHSSGADFAEDFCKSGKTLIILDESSRIKSPTSARTKNVLKLRQYSAFRRIMSGTPITKGVEDLYSQFLFLDPAILGYSSFFTFRTRFCNMGGFEGRQIVSYRNIPELQKRVDGHTYRKTKEECLDLPEKIFTIRSVEFTSEQLTLYTQIKDKYMAELTEGLVVDLPLAITRMLRLQQILSGHFPNPETGEMIHVPTNRTDALIDVLEEAGESKVIVWGKFTHDIDEISRRLTAEGIGYVVYTGNTSPTGRTDSIERFRNDPTCKVFLGNPAAAGIGLNLTVANVVVWYSTTFNLDEYLQANDRCHRIGQKWPVTYVTLTTPGSLDVKIAKALQKKKGVADMVLDIREFLD